MLRFFPQEFSEIREILKKFFTCLAYQNWVMITGIFLEGNFLIHGVPIDYAEPVVLAIAMNLEGTIVEAILQKTVRMDSKFINGLTPLSWAAQNRNEELVKLLLEHKADIDAKTKYG